MVLSTKMYGVLLLLISFTAYEVYSLSIDCGEFYIGTPKAPVWASRFFYSCNGTVQNYGVNRNVTELFGTHKDGWNSTELQSISLKNQNLTSFPTDIVKLLPNLQEIALSFNSITRVTNYHLKPFLYLSYLIMDHNQISYLDKNIFHGVNFLYLVDLSHNNIKHMVVDYTWPMVRMDFRNNTCIDELLSGVADSDEEIECFKSHIRNQCAPPKPTVVQSSVHSESVNFADESDSFIDHTIPKTGISRQSTNDDMNEFMACVMSVVSGVPISEQCKETFAIVAGISKSSLRYADPAELGDNFNGPIVQVRLSPFAADLWGSLSEKVNKTLVC